jgi:fermentation-respiration switch protein FrsA (DUF1100 family)
LKVLTIFFCAAAGLYLLLTATLFFTQRSLLYYPSHAYVPLSEANANKAFQEISVKTEDGIDLKAWYAPAASKHYTIVFFHGNADSLHSAAQIADPYIAAGYGFLVAEYRGYSGLPGKPTEIGLYADGRAYIGELMRRGVDSQRIILMGHSLGTGVAVEMAQENHVGGLMLLAPYVSMPKVAQAHFSIFPVGILVLDRFENAKKIGSIHEPILIVNGSRDDVVLPAQGRELYNLANEPKELHTLPNRGHNDLFDDFAPLSLDWIDRACAGKG